jgi:nicotinic acid mononucleotide adenylyltransferase
MKHDPIVEGIHQTRQKMLEECHNDLDQLLDRLKTAEIQDRSRMVSLETLKKTRRREPNPHLTNKD